MSQVTVITTITTSPVTVVWSGSSPITTTVMIAPTSVGLPTSGKHDVVLPLQLILRATMKWSGGLTTMPQQWQHQSQLPSQAYANCAMGPPQVSFSFKGEPVHIMYVGVCYGFCFQVTIWLPCSPVGLNHWVCITTTTQNIPVVVICTFLWCLWLMPRVHWLVAAPTALGRRELYGTHSAVTQPFNKYCRAYSFWGLAEGHQILPPSPHVGEQSSFPDYAPPVTQLNSGVLYCLITHLTWFHGKGTLNHLLLEPGCEGYAFLDQAVKDWTWSWFSIDTLKLDESFDEADAMPFPVSSWYICSGSTIFIILDCNLFLTSNLANCGARLGHYFTCTTDR